MRLSIDPKMQPAVQPLDHTGFASLCPFHDGPATIDLLLAELDPRNRELFDAALDLRALVKAGDDPTACAEQLFRLRALLHERHYLAFYRVRCWARRAMRVEVRRDRRSPWTTCEMPLGCARFDELVNGALAHLAADEGALPDTAHVRFSFVAPA